MRSLFLLGVDGVGGYGFVRGASQLDLILAVCVVVDRARDGDDDIKGRLAPYDDPVEDDELESNAIVVEDDESADTLEDDELEDSAELDLRTFNSQLCGIQWVPEVVHR